MKLAVRKKINKRILCYGDSNTWGYNPISTDRDIRFPSNIRWTGLLQEALIKSTIIEEGLNGRTTDLDDPDVEGKNGYKAFSEILAHHLPVDLTILMLGTNDLKKKFNRTPLEIQSSLRKLIRHVSETAPHAILVLSPPIPKLDSAGDAYRYPELEEKARSLASLYESLAKTQRAFFIDTATFIDSSSIDGIHFDEQEQQKFAEIVLDFIEDLFESI